MCCINHGGGVSYQPAPFFVLDEIDAALDNTNINRVSGSFMPALRKRDAKRPVHWVTLGVLDDEYYI